MARIYALARRLRSADRQDGGWTLIELIVVLSIIMVLASIAMVQYRNSETAAQEAVLKTNLFRMRDAIDRYYADKGSYPDSLDELVSQHYLRALPEDPFMNNSTTSWVTTPAEPDPNNPSAAAGIYDVKSASDRTALDGSKYADW